MSTETEAKPFAAVADDTEAIARATWETAYPDRSPWERLEPAAREEWCRVVRVMRSIPNTIAPAESSPVVAWQKGILRVHDNADLDCTDVYILTIGGRIVFRAIEPAHGLGAPVSESDRELIGKALSLYLRTEN